MTKTETKKPNFVITPPEMPFEVYPHDLPETMTFTEAEKAAAALGDGWRLPTREELLIMSKNVEKIPGICLEDRGGSDYPDWYWSCSEYRDFPDLVWDVRLSDGDDGWGHKDFYRLSCRPVRTGKNDNQN